MFVGLLRRVLSRVGSAAGRLLWRLLVAAELAVFALAIVVVLDALLTADAGDETPP